jgi:hypothetical protein
MLHNHGLTTLTELYNVPIGELARIPTIGSSIAESIKKQLGLDEKSGIPVDEDELLDVEESDSIQTLLEDFAN